MSTVIGGIYESYRNFKSDIETEGSPVCPTAFAWSDKDTVLAIIRSVLWPSLCRMQCSPQQARSLTVSIAAAFTGSVTTTTSGEVAPYVHFETVVSPRFKSCLLHDSLLLNIPCRDRFGLRCTKQNVKIAIFESSLELPVIDSNVDLEIETSAHHAEFPVFHASERKILLTFADAIHSSGVGVLFCQRRIPSFLADALEKRGVMAIQRVSIRYIAALSRLTGAALLGALDPVAFSEGGILPSSSLGCLKSAQWKNVAGRHFLFCEAYKQAEYQNLAEIDLHVNVQQRILPVMTVLLYGLNESCCIELKSVCEKVVKVLSQSLRQPLVLQGAGKWQELAGIRQLYNFFPARVHRIGDAPARLLGTALLEYANIITCGEVQADMVERKSSSETFSPPIKPSGPVLDVFALNIRAVENAVEAACCILNVDGAVIVQEHSNIVQFLK